MHKAQPSCTLEECVVKINLAIFRAFKVYDAALIHPTLAFTPFEKGGRGDLKISTVATILNPPHSPFVKGGS